MQRTQNVLLAFAALFLLGYLFLVPASPAPSLVLSATPSSSFASRDTESVILRKLLDDDPTQVPSRFSVFPSENPTPAPVSKKTTFVLNTSTKKFHKPSCASVKQIKAKNKKTVTSTRQEIINQGYDPCGRCHP